MFDVLFVMKYEQRRWSRNLEVYGVEEGKKGETKTETQMGKKTTRKQRNKRRTPQLTGAGDEPQFSSLVGEKDCASLPPLPLLLLLSVVEGRWKLPLAVLLVLEPLSCASCWRPVSYSGDASLHVAPADGEDMFEESKDVLNEVIMSMPMLMSR